MIDFKKRALILTLAATVSVTGSFAANNYKNCLMGMEFKQAGENQIDVVLNTKNPYENNVSPIKKDANTYVIMLPETDNNSPTPNITEAGGCIESVDVRKMPYSNGYKGYTKILIKTSGSVNLNASTAIYVPSADEPKLTMTQNIPRTDYVEPEVRQKTDTYENKYGNDRRKSSYNKNPSDNKDIKTDNATKINDINDGQTIEIGDDNSLDDYNNVGDNSDSQNIVNNSKRSDIVSQKYLLALSFILIIMISAYLYVKAQDKLKNAMGESLKIDFEEESKEEKETSKRRKIRNTINKLDDMYSQSAAISVKEFFNAKKNDSQETQDESNVVDLDALFKEKQAEKQDDSSNPATVSDALDDFLKGFLLETPNIKESIEKPAGYDQETYEKLLKNKDIIFSKDDIACLNELLQSEISDAVIESIEKYAMSNPIESSRPAKEKLLENIITEYAISQNITFSSGDIDIIKRLSSVELDPDFLSDLRTNSDRTAEMANEITLSKTTKQNSSEILTLNVKDLLPNLSDALKKQGNKPIESEVKHDVVYFSEGYEVSTLSQDFDLPDLAKEIKNKRAYMSKPSAEVETVDQSYTDSVRKLSISGLPDLEDVIAHPEKYEEEKIEEPVADENALLNSIMNVQFKPFDDGTRKFEIINDFEEEESPQEPSPTVADIQKEFSQFANFEVAEYNSAEEINNTYTENQDDFENIYKQNYVDLDLNKNEDNYIDTIAEKEPEKVEKSSKIEEPKKAKIEEQLPEKIEIAKETSVEITEKAKQHIDSEPFILKDLNRAKPKITMRNGKEKSEKLMNMIDKLRTERINKKSELKKSNTISKSAKEKQENTITPSIVKCIFEGTNYDILASVPIQANIGCHLAKSANGYAVLSYAGSNIAILKEYDTLKNEKINVRLSETLDDGTPRYIIKAGSNKFIVELRDGQAKYVMDLC